MYKKLCVLASIITSSFVLHAQVKTNFNNTEKLINNSKFNIEYPINPSAVYQITPPDLSNAYKRDKAEAENFSKVFYIAEPITTKINVTKQANWIIKEEFAFAKLTIKAKNAKTISINFSDFFLPKGTEMFIYNENAEMITGVITDEENNKEKIWGSSIYKGDQVNIEFRTPIQTKEKISLQISNVAYGYKDIFVDKISGFNSSGSCNINVLCPQGNGWELKEIPLSLLLIQMVQLYALVLCS